MNHRLIERVLVGLLLVIAGGIVVHAPLSVWLGTVWPHLNEVIKSWPELLMGLALVLLAVEVVRHKMINTLLDDRLMQLALVFAGLHFVMMAVLSNGLHAEGAGLLIDLRFILYFVLVYGTLKVFPQYRSLFIKVFAGGAVVVIGFALLQLFVLPKDILAHIGYGDSTIEPYLTVDRNPNYIRINSTLRGPNPLGAYAMIVLAFMAAYALKYGRKLKAGQRWAFVIIAAMVGWVLWTSYSRSSLVGIIVAILVMFAAVSPVKARRRLVIAAVSAAVVIGGLLFVFRDNSTVSNVILHENPTTVGGVSSNVQHTDSLVDGVKRFIVEPLGTGVGSTGDASLGTPKSLIIENQYLFVAHEVGWVGLAVFIWLYGEILHRLWQRRAGLLALGTLASGWGLAIIGLLLPVWTDDTIGIVWWGLAAVAIAGEFKGKKHGARKSH